jgi:hypothetical protein
MPNAKNLRLLLTALATLLATPALAVDSDGDGVDDTVDNCSAVANADQRDSNGDGFGNVCDSDLNNDLIVNAGDLGLLRSVFFTSDEDADADGDGTVNVGDLGAMRAQFFGPPGPGATGVQAYTQRPVVYQLDFDNNGLVDATSIISYDADGNVTQQLYTVPGDGTPDLFNPVSESGFQADYSYTDGLLTMVQQDNFTSGNDFQSVYTYDGNGVLTRTDETVFAASGNIVSEIYVVYDYVDDLRTREEWYLTSSDLLILVINHTYDANDLIDASSWVSQLSPGGVDYDFDWNGDGKLVQRRLDAEADGVFDETIVTLHQGGRPVSRTVTGSLSYDPPNYSETVIYDASGRIERIDYDANADGSVDAVATPVWENGPCRRFFLPSLIPTNNAGFDGDPDTPVGDVLFCAP